jgi:uracil-DNA glycosylase
MGAIEALICDIRNCQVCEAVIAHGVRPVVQFSNVSRLLIIGQAPGALVHAIGIPWDDASGDRLRAWTGLDRTRFYDPKAVALVPMGFCYPGTGASGDLPPRPECAPLWHDRVLASLTDRRLTLLVGSYAEKRYLASARKLTLTQTVQNQEGHGPDVIALPHPSWRSTGWMQKNLWFESDLVPRLQARIAEALSD